MPRAAGSASTTLQERALVLRGRAARARPPRSRGSRRRPRARRPAPGRRRRTRPRRRAGRARRRAPAPVRSRCGPGPSAARPHAPCARRGSATPRSPRCPGAGPPVGHAGLVPAADVLEFLDLRRRGLRRSASSCGALLAHAAPDWSSNVSISCFEPVPRRASVSAIRSRTASSDSDEPLALPRRPRRPNARAPRPRRAGRRPPRRSGGEPPRSGGAPPRPRGTPPRPPRARVRVSSSSATTAVSSASMRSSSVSTASSRAARAACGGELPRARVALAVRPPRGSARSAPVAVERA